MTAFSATPKSPFPLKKASLNCLLYVGTFLLIYTAINYLRKPVMPANSPLVFADMNGQTIDLAKMSEKQAVLVYFWGTWCGVCRQTTPMVNSLTADSYPVVSVAVQSDDDSELGSYVKQHQLDFSVINDNEGKLFQAWQGQVTPSYAIVSQGQVVQGFTGIQPTWVLKIRMAWANGIG